MALPISSLTESGEKMQDHEFEEALLQTFLAIEGFCHSAINAIVKEDYPKALAKVANALEIAEKKIKSIRGF